MPQTPLFLLRQLVGHIKVSTMKLLCCLLPTLHAPGYKGLGQIWI